MKSARKLTENVYNENVYNITKFSNCNINIVIIRLRLHNIRIEYVRDIPSNGKCASIGLGPIYVSSSTTNMLFKYFAL